VPRFVRGFGVRNMSKETSMKSILKTALAISAVTFAAHASAQVTFYEYDGFAGRAFTTQSQIGNFERFGFNDRASSVVVAGGPWEVCDDSGFRGRCVVLRPGNYASLTAMGLNDRVSSARAVGREARMDDDRYAPAPMPAQITFYEHDGFQGQSFSTDKEVRNFERFGFNDRASSAVVFGTRWEVCEDTRFSGRCVVLRPGRYPSLGAMGLNDRVSSVRAVSPTARFDDSRYAPPPEPVYDWRRRHNERVYEVNVDSVHAVLAAPGQRCWVEPGQVVQQQRSPNVGGALSGGLIGGILGHQVGGGSGKDVATVGGAVAGAAIGSNVGRDGQQTTTTPSVQRCESTPSQARPEYWDVSYNFRGQEHRVQMSTPPGPTLIVNEQGEPRV